jgi:hypothetical protein
MKFEYFFKITNLVFELMNKGVVMDGFENWHLKPLDPIQTHNMAVQTRYQKICGKQRKKIWKSTLLSTNLKVTKIISPLTWYIKIIFHTMEYITRYLIHTEIKSCGRSICVSNAKMVKILMDFNSQIVQS